MKTLIAIFGLLMLTLTACLGVEEPVAEPTEVETDVTTYTWTKYPISFEVPEGLVVSDMAYIEALYLSEQDMSMAEGDNPGDINIHPYTDKTVEDLIAQYSSEEDFTQESVEFGENTYTKITYYSQFGDYTPESYLIENNGTAYVITRHWASNQTDIEVILESLEF